jgi:ectoine hydroxylase-related dioxygenase (phytanoyl-CoA dioxygenase family)
VSVPPASVDRQRIDDDFAVHGHIALRGAFSRDDAARMSLAIWHHLESNTAIRRDDERTWPTGWLPVSFKKLKRHAAFRSVIEAPDVRAVLDQIFGVDAWTSSKGGAQILTTFPNTDPDQWRVPHHLWHMDSPFRREVESPHAVKLFSVVESLPARNGATMVIAGTHELQAEYARSIPAELRAGKAQTWRRFLTEVDPWLAALVSNRPSELDDPDRNERFTGPHDINGRTVEIRELTGSPGDVHVTHLNLFHAASPNAGRRPRIVVTHVVTPITR